MSTTLPTDWKATGIQSFTTIFGTILNGSEITWYNNPSTADTETAAHTDLKIRWVQNLYTAMYTWWDSSTSNSDDAQILQGDYDYTGESVGSEWPADGA